MPTVCVFLPATAAVRLHWGGQQTVGEPYLPTDQRVSSTRGAQLHHLPLGHQFATPPLSSLRRSIQLSDGRSHRDGAACADTFLQPSN